MAKKNRDKKEKLPYVLKDVESAIRTLDKFSNENFSVIGAPMQPLGLGDAVSHVAKILFLSLSSKAIKKIKEEQRAVRHELLTAIETLKNCYPLIEIYQNGTPEQQKLAATAKESIRNFNDSIDKRKGSTHWTNKVASFFLEDAAPYSWLSADDKIDLPFTATLKLNDIKKEKQFLTLPLFTLRKGKKSQNTESLPSTQASDLFRMKAIRLLRENEIALKRESLRHSPIRVQRIEEENEQILSLFQTLKPFPGEVIELKGSIKKNGDSDPRPIPLPETFHIATTAIQTGFPHPLQHTGWALADQLIPACPHRQDEMRKFSVIQKKKRDIALSLLPKGCNNEIAKELLNRKREAFLERKSAFLAMHKDLSLAIIDASHEIDAEKEQFYGIVEQFFTLLDSESNCYDYLSEVNQAVNDIFIRLPYEKLQHLRFFDAELQDRVKQRGYQAVYEILEKEANKHTKMLSQHYKDSTNAMEKAAIEYILLMGSVMKKAFFFIILQEKSEIIGFAPPLLTNFARKVQAATFLQLTQFINEIEICDNSAIDTLLEENLKEDISLFQARSEDDLGTLTDLVNEMEEYYNQRYYSRNKKQRNTNR